MITTLDIETTGISPEDGHKIIEVAARVDVTHDRGKTHKQIGKTYVQRFNPKRSIDRGAQNVHGISLLDLKYEPFFEGTSSKLFGIIKLTDVIVAHNSEFDVPFIIHELRETEMYDMRDLMKVDTFCTMKNGIKATPMGKWPKLSELAFALGFEYDPAKAHAAEYDVDITANCFWKGIETGFYTLP